MATTTTIRGGWSTSIADLFANPLHKANCCACVCCGLFLHDRNSHLLHKQQQNGQQSPTNSSSAWCRLFCCVGIPILIVTTLLVAKQIVLSEQIEINNNQRTPLNGTNVFTPDLEDDDLVLEEEAALNTLILGVVVIMSVVLCCVSRSEQLRNREAVLLLMHQHRQQQQQQRGMDRGNGNEDDDDDAVVGARLAASGDMCINQADVRAAHAICWCHKNDVEKSFSTTDGRMMASFNDNDDGDNNIMMTKPEADLCTCMYGLFNWVCCGCLCDRYCQCCGLCGIAQEDRELRRLLPASELQVDYITYQPYVQYFGRIQQLRAQQAEGLWRHACWATSRLTQQLYKITGFCLLTLTIIAASSIDPNFHVTNLILVFATMAQAAVVMLCVHWCTLHKFDVSVDAVVKYFSSGFCLSTFLAMAYEVFVGGVIGFFASIVVAVGISSELDVNNPDPTQVERLSRAYKREHLGFSTVVVFLQAFVVAALVEELVKYFGYWMVETPDLMEPNELVEPENRADLALSQEDGGGIDEQSSSPQSQGISMKEPPRSLVSRGAGTTIAMVAVAAGFACAENFMYVFIYAPPGIENQVGTLIARSLFPVHPLCAAIQSIGVVKRDLERNTKWQLGRIILPAILLHGCFDFILMLLQAIQKHNKFKENGGITNDDLSPNQGDTGAENVEVTVGDLIALATSVACVIVAIFYYICQSWAQRKRLVELDQQRRSDSPGFPAPLV